MNARGVAPRGVQAKMSNGARCCRSSRCSGSAPQPAGPSPQRAQYRHCSGPSRATQAHSRKRSKTLEVARRCRGPVLAQLATIWRERR
jgi:hypothetical protein